MSSSKIRLNKYIARCGICSRRQADDYISQGLVRVNGQIVTEFGLQINPKNDTVFVKNKPVRSSGHKEYYMLNKPPQVMTTMSDPQQRACVADFVAHLKTRVFPVGRLDWDSEGLLLMTNDGDFANRVMHPQFGVTKTYLVKLNGQPTDAHLMKLRRGVTIQGGLAKAILAEKIFRGRSSTYSWIKIIINEGRKRQIRRMIEKIGFDVKKLQRVAIGRLTLGDLKRGEIRPLKARDLERIFLTDLDVQRRDERKKQLRSKSSKPKSRHSKISKKIFNNKLNKKLF